MRYAQRKEILTKSCESMPEMGIPVSEAEGERKLVSMHGALLCGNDAIGTATANDFLEAKMSGPGQLDA